MLHLSKCKPIFSNFSIFEYSLVLNRRGAGKIPKT